MSVLCTQRILLMIIFKQMCSGYCVCLLCGCQYLHSAATEICRNLEQAQDSNDWNKVCMLWL